MKTFLCDITKEGKKSARKNQPIRFVLMDSLRDGSARVLDWRKMSDWLTRDHVITRLNSRWLPKYFLEFFLSFSWRVLTVRLKRNAELKGTSLVQGRLLMYRTICCCVRRLHLVCFETRFSIFHFLKHGFFHFRPKTFGVGYKTTSTFI